MKRFILIVLLAVVSLNVISAAEAAEKPTFGLHMILLGSWAPLGLGAEYFIGPVGLSAQITMLPFGSEGNYIFFYEPGAGVRAYFSHNTDNSFYAGFSTHYCGALGGSGGVLENADFNVMRFNGLLGFNLLIGEENTGRMAFEIGPRFNVATNTDTSDRASWFLVHFQMMFGRVW